MKYDSHSYPNHMKTVDSVSVIAHGVRSDVSMSTGSHRQAEAAESAAMFARSVRFLAGMLRGVEVVAVEQVTASLAEVDYN